MDREQRIDQEVRKTLDQFERGERITPNPFFRTRIEARLRKRDEAKGWVLVFRALKPALLALLIACNIATATVLLRRGAGEGFDRSDVVSAIGEELGLDRHAIDLFLTE